MDKDDGLQIDIHDNVLSSLWTVFSCRHIQWSRGMRLFGFKAIAKQFRVPGYGQGAWLLLRITMFGKSLRCLLTPALCLSVARDQFVFEEGGSPVLRRFNVTSSSQLDNALSKALVGTPCVMGLSRTQDKLYFRTMVSMSGKLPRTTSMSTSPPTPPDRLSSYRSRTSRCSTLSPVKQSMKRPGIRRSQLRLSTLPIILFRR